MSPTLSFLIVVFEFIVRLAVPFVLFFGVLYLVKRWLEPRVELSSRLPKVKMPFNLHPVIVAIICLVVITVIGIVGYTLITNQFVDLLLVFRDAITIAYMFLLRIVTPIVLLYLGGTWLERKLNPAPAGATERRSLSERLPILQKVQLPQFTSKGLLAILFIAILWTAAIGIAISRFLFGLSYVTNLTDEYPWGIWIGFDVASGVALAAGGFVIAGTVHVFNIKRYHAIVRPALLTALLGYILVIIGLLFDLGRWYNVWHPIFGAPFGMANIHSPMFEVAWCVVLYTTVLMLEFSPVVFEKLRWQRALKFMRMITLPLVILGMCLSTLHQSSLGSLFLIAPEKINPLWYSALVPVFFFLSAVCVGLGMTILESNISSRALHREPENDLLAGLGKASVFVIAIYLVIKFADLIYRGALGYAFTPGFHATIFWLEIGLGFIVPMVLMAFNRLRSNPRIVFLSGALIVGGVVFNRLNTTILGTWQYVRDTNPYVPSIPEVTISVALVSVGVIVFGLAAKFLPLFENKEHAHA
ncbi:MAG: Ni/Fe-hydrogenase cytochrome b subunit [Chloroflexi bacterium]|nr:Ni/Fe-hydrogenase cytochrome b subunit [Chloroflexota bacterium]